MTFAFIKSNTVLLIISMLGVFLFPQTFAYAQSEIEKLRNQIENRNDELKDIEAEIAEYQAELQKVGSEKASLQNAINQLEVERKKVIADISYTQNKIGTADLEINRLSLEIEDTEDVIDVNREAIIKTLQQVHEMDNDTLFEAMLRHDNLSDFWGEVDTLNRVRSVIADEVRSLLVHKETLNQKHGETTEKREELVELKQQYADQNTVLEVNKAEKTGLLTETQNEEAQYQKLLQEKEAAREQILKEIREFESEIQFILDPNTVPTPGTQVFNWPVANVTITQLFGGTEFAKSNSSVYGGRAYHPGVDFGAPRGTKIYAPLAGTVRATGNTDSVAGCYSWGKWTLIDHANGLSTLYAHQSVISVEAGDKVGTGQVIGYIGNTGYSTGPHLHFTVYAKEGVSVRRFNEIKAVTSCGAATTPVAATDAYLDPMLYLPQ